MSTEIYTLVLAVVAIITLCWQFFANKRQKFENHFFELLRIHRQNVEEMKIGLLEKREIFKEFFYELITYHLMVNNTFSELTNENYKDKELHKFYSSFKQECKNNLAYLLFFHGTEYNHIFKVVWTNNSIVDEDKKNAIMDKIRNKIIEQNKWQQGNFSITDCRKNERGELLSYYKPYGNHSQCLGHYYRHLYQTIKFVDDACSCKKRKYKYIKMLKAQLSDFEQALLFYHACSDLGKVWFEKAKSSYIVKYRLIQNLPLFMIYDDECRDLNDKLSQYLSNREIELYFSAES